jgi:sigma-B regulation protein RsbU (phosphoserine phosphatase)
MKNPIPYLVKEENIKFYEITQIVYYVGLLGHFNAFFMFWWLDVPEMLLFNIFISLPSFTFALVLNRLGKHSAAFALAFSELFLHQLTGTFYLGWAAGFQFWLVYLAGLSFFNYQWRSITNYLGLLLVIAGFVTLYIHA